MKKRNGNEDYILDEPIFDGGSPVSDDSPIKTLKEYVAFIDTWIDRRPVHIKAEVGSCRSYMIPIGDATYHYWYFNILESDKIIPCYWKANKNLKLETGQEIEINGDLVFKPDKSGLTIKVDKVDIVGIGRKWKKYLKIIETQKEAGVYTNTRVVDKVKNIGLISSASTEAYTDFHTILTYTIQLLCKDKTLPDYEVKLYPASMSGARGSKSIIEAIATANADIYFSNDILVISRGGGSIESMWCFNNEQLAEAIYNSKIPVLSAVGHERDVTLCDKAADMRASTPSHAGMMIAELLL